MEEFDSGQYIQIFISGTGLDGCKMPHFFQVLMLDVHSHFQESPAWNYFDFQFDKHEI
jgi:hypothetical protein